MNPLDVARALLAADRPLGRVYLAAIRVAPARLLSYLQALAPNYARDQRIAEAQATLAAVETEQRAHGFGTGEAEFLAALADVEPLPVETFAHRHHGATIATCLDSQAAGWVAARAEVRDDKRWSGAWAEGWIVIGDDEVPVGLRLEGPTARAEGAAFVGRWLRVGRAALALFPRAS